MADIINFKEARDKEEGVFAIREDDGELKPMEQWTGEDWETFFTGPMTAIAQQIHVSPWEVFAEFMTGILDETYPEGRD